MGEIWKRWRKNTGKFLKFRRYAQYMNTVFRLTFTREGGDHIGTEKALRLLVSPERHASLALSEMHAVYFIFNEYVYLVFINKIRYNIKNSC